MVENIRFHPKFFKKMTFRKWIFSTIFWCDTKLSQVRQQGVAFCTSLSNCDSLLSHLFRQPDTYLDARHKAGFFMRLA
jgi:hypothetical protein